jgi:hypothetical protein
VAFVRNREQHRHVAHSLVGDWVSNSHTRLFPRAYAERRSGCGNEAGACAVLWLPESSSGTHNEFRISVSPLSGDWGARAPLLIYTRGGSKLERAGHPLVGDRDDLLPRPAVDFRSGSRQAVEDVARQWSDFASFREAHFRGTEVDLRCTSTIRPSVNSAMLTILLAQGMLGMGYARGGSTECHVNGRT